MSLPIAGQFIEDAQDVVELQQEITATVARFWYARQKRRPVDVGQMRDNLSALVLTYGAFMAVMPEPEEGFDLLRDVIDCPVFRRSIMSIKQGFEEHCRGIN